MPKIHIDGRSYDVAPGQNLLEACLGLGFHLPFFCWHPAMGSVGACRQCAIKHFKDEADAKANGGRLVMSCMTAAEEGIRISVDDPQVVAFRASIIEGMMLHHPHDCPVCDEGGHCHLQDMTVMTGHNYRRYRFSKRTFRNQYLGPLINHEMNRCIQCYRCVRYYREYAGGADFNAFGISDHVFFGRERDGVLENEFAGNLVEVCPTGVFTDATLKQHYTRKWDLRWTPSVCPHCALGCNTSPGERYGTVRAVFNRYNSAVNGYFLCDRGRFGYEYLSSPERVTLARQRRDGVRADLTPEAALAQLTQAAAGVAADPPGRWIGIGSPRASMESNFALRQLVGAERFFAGVEAHEWELDTRIAAILRQGAVHSPSLGEVERCDAALVLGEDLTQTAARMALSLRQAMRQQPLREICDPLKIPHWLDHAAREAIQGEHGPLFLATTAATKLDDIATHTWRAAPDDVARLGYAVAAALNLDQDTAGTVTAEWRAAAAEVADALLAAERPLIVTGVSSGNRGQIEAALAIAAALAVRGKHPAVSFVLPECNTLGLALLGARPLPEGMDMVRFGLAHGAIVVENDLFRRAPAEEAKAFLAQLDQHGGHLVVLDQIRHATADAAELLLPAAGVTEGSGTLISSEGRAQRFFTVAAPTPNRAESWSWLEAAQGHTPALDDMVAQLCALVPELEPLRQAAPPATLRLAGQKVARETHRFSGRTSIDAAIEVSEPKPPVDPDAPLSFTMEGYAAQPPAALIPYFWSPGWNSPQAQLPYQQRINAPLRGGDAGVRLLEQVAGSQFPCAGEPPPRFEPKAGRWLIIRLYHLFGSEVLSGLGRAVGSLAPDAYVALNPADAERAGLKEGDAVRVEPDGRRGYQVPLRLLPELPVGVAGVPAGFTAFDGAGLPHWGTVTAEAPHA
ncbi:MAG TPA: NADH-quinone oxidoreductase subunit NuoG [Terriglobales bacterium]|jgi:NADH-quinone oxidoreductase subunit G